MGVKSKTEFLKSNSEARRARKENSISINKSKNSILVDWEEDY